MTFVDLSFWHRCFLVCLYLVVGFSLEGRTLEPHQNIVPHWSSMTSDFPKGFQVQALTLDPEQKLLYIAGTYNDTTFYVKRWDGSVWENIGDPLNGAAKALAMSDSTLYIGGEFTGTATQPNSLQHIARYDNAVKAWAPVGVGLDNSVLALCSNGHMVYVGGTFRKTSDGAEKLNCITVWDGTQFNQLGSSGAPGLGASLGDCSVQALLLVGTDLYVGGTFTRDNIGTALNRVAKLDTTNNIFLPLGRGFNNGCVNALVFNGSKIIAGGSFNQVNLTTGSGQFFHAGYIAEWDEENWMSLGDFNNPVQSIITNGSKLYAAGMFTKNGVTPIDHISQYDYRRPAKKWLPLSLEDNGLTKKEGLVSVNALGKWGNTLFACGNFDASHNVPDLNGVAVWSDTICANCLYCGFTPDGVFLKQLHETASCQALVIVPSISAPFGVELQYFTQLKAKSKDPLSWEGVPKIEVFHNTLLFAKPWEGVFKIDAHDNTLLLTNLDPGQDYRLRTYSVCTFPVSSPISFSPPRTVTFGTRTVTVGKIKVTSAEISIGLEFTINAGSVTAYYRETGTDFWKTQSSNNPKHPNLFKIKGLLPNTEYEFKAGFIFIKSINDVLTPVEVVETCIYTFRTK